MIRRRILVVGDTTLPYTLMKRRGQRTMALSVHGDGRITLTVPRWTSVAEAVLFIERQAKWILRTVEKIPAHLREDPLVRTAHYRLHREAARTFVQARLTALNEHYHFAYNRVAIRKNSSRWGSCSENGNLNFDYRILFLPPHLQDYLLVHELCHLRELNHGPAFWSLVAQTVPDHAACRSELRRVVMSTL